MVVNVISDGTEKVGDALGSAWQGLMDLRRISELPPNTTFVPNEGIIIRIIAR